MDRTVFQNLSAGIKTKAATQYAELGFDIIKNEEKRGEARKRCATIEAYYAEKAVLLSNSKTENSAGFIIKALQEDWLASKTIKAIEEQKAVREHRQQQNILKQLEKQFEALRQQYEKAKESIIDRLIAGETYFQTAYDGVMNQFDTASLFSRSVRQFSAPRAAYQDYVALRSLMNAYIEKHFPTEFDSLSAFVSEITAAKKEIEGLKK